MPDRRTSREIIWKHAFDYGWTRFKDINGNPAVDAFNRGRMDHWADPPKIIVWYSRDGRRVTDVTVDGNRPVFCTRGGVMDALETRSA